MPLTPEDTQKVAALQLMIAEGRAIRVSEIVAVFWPQPTGTVYYAATQLDDLYPDLGLSPVEARLPWNSGAPFSEVVHESGLSDEEVELDFWDADGRVADLFEQHGAGVRVEIFYYFPDVDLLLSEWWGHLQPPEEADEERFVATAAVGFQSSMLPLPRRAFFSGCQAIDGVLLTTAEEIAANDCPRDMHIGGSVGVVGMENHLCPRRNRQDCIDHIGDSLSMLAFDTVVESIINRQTEGPTRLATSRGNESNLKRPLRVIIGERTVRELDLLAYTPQTNNNTPDQGYVRVLFAICEGRVKSITLCKVNNSLIGFEHLNWRLGARRQPPTGFSPNVPNYSGTALFYGVYGPVDPSQYNATNLSGEAKVEGLDDMRVYTAETAYTEQYTRERG
ncbi:MAG TPA: hypothetical protein VD861_00990, partial [Pyrinomonadaceae bacterium]|nr:hypothetical protein [Pyrinomonadaceae bacterium]